MHAYKDDEYNELVKGFWEAIDAFAKQDRRFQISYCLYFNVDDFHGQMKTRKKRCSVYEALGVQRYRKWFMLTHSHRD